MKLFFALVFFALAAASARADDYVCKAAGNPDRGFPTPLRITISPDAEGSPVIYLGPAGEKLLGKVRKITSLDKSTPAFAATLSLIGEKDTSGLDAKGLAKITRIAAYEIENPDVEAKVFRLFAGDKQTGGTLLLDVHGTRCLP
jgi:hypothetical protein